MKDSLKEILPAGIERNGNYNLKKRPAEHVMPTMKMATYLVEKEKTCFLPLKTSSIPSHVKTDTDALSTMILNAKSCKQKTEEVAERNLP